MNCERIYTCEPVIDTDGDGKEWHPPRFQLYFADIQKTAMAKMLCALSLEHYLTIGKETECFWIYTPADIALSVTSTADGVRNGRRSVRCTVADTPAASHAPITAACDTVTLILAAIRRRRR